MAYTLKELVKELQRYPKKCESWKVEINNIKSTLKSESCIPIASINEDCAKNHNYIYIITD